MGRRKLLIIVTSLIFIIGLSVHVSNIDTRANNAVTITNVKISDTTPDYGDLLTFTFNVSANNEINYVFANIQYGKYAEVSSPVSYNPSTGEATVSCNVEFFGHWQINYITVTDVDGNTYYIYNDNVEHQTPGSQSIDMSEAIAIVNNDPGDTTVPVIVTSTIDSDKETYKINETAYIDIEVTDNDEVQAVFVVVKMGNANEVQSGTILENGKFRCMVNITAAGTYEVVSIRAFDRSGNCTQMYNSKYSGHNNFTQMPEGDLSGANFTVKTANENDTQGPQIQIDTLKVIKTKVGLREENTISVKITDDSGIQSVTPFVKQGKGGICEFGDAFRYNASEGTYEFTVNPDYYGLWELAGIIAQDENGNITRLYSNGYSGFNGFNGYFGTATTTKNLSAANFYVGIADEDTGIFITGDGMETDVTMDASELEHKGDKYDKMHRKDYRVHGFYEVHVDGEYKHNNEKVRVEFPVKGKKDGDRIHIRHMHKDGRIEDFSCDVRGGKAVVYVDDFSPFMVMSSETDLPDVNISYRTHIESIGWEGPEDNINTWKKNGVMSGTSGRSLRLEGINIVVDSAEVGKDVDLGIQYTTHCESYGWLPWSADGDMNGTEGESKRLEAIMIQLTGADAENYDVHYRVHAEAYGWLGWASNGAPAGTAGYSKRLEGIQIVVVRKGESFNQNMGDITSKQTAPFVPKSGNSPIVNYPATSNTNPVVPGEDTPNVSYRTHVEKYSWQAWKYNGQMSGTSGESKRLEGIEIKLTNKDYSGGIAYTTHVEKYAWQNTDLNNPATWKQDGQMAGTSGESKRLEAICITLTGEMAEHYDIYYRVHAEQFGWLGWASNGDPAGTAGHSKRLEGIQIILVPKGGAAPGITYNGITSTNPNEYIEKLAN